MVTHVYRYMGRASRGASEFSYFIIRNTSVLLTNGCLNKHSRLTVQKTTFVEVIRD
jgi:hypothetical protein